MGSFPSSTLAILNALLRMIKLLFLRLGSRTGTLEQLVRKPLSENVFCLEATRRRMKCWAISAGDKSWAVKLDARDLGGHLDITRRARAGTFSVGLSKLPRKYTWLVLCLLDFFGWLGWFGLSSYLLVFMALRAPHLSGKNLNAFRSSVVRACWPRKLPMSTPYAVLSLLDAPEGCDPGYFVIWGGVSDK